MIRRREFITLLGGAAATWPVAALAQHSAMPVIGFLSPGSPEADTNRLTGVRRGLAEIGYVEGQNVAIEYRWAQFQYAHLPALAVDLVCRLLLEKKKKKKGEHAHDELKKDEVEQWTTRKKQTIELKKTR